MKKNVMESEPNAKKKSKQIISFSCILQAVFCLLFIVNFGSYAFIYYNKAIFKSPIFFFRWNFLFYFFNPWVGIYCYTAIFLIMNLFCDIHYKLLFIIKSFYSHQNVYVCCSSDDGNAVNYKLFFFHQFISQFFSNDVEISEQCFQLKHVRKIDNCFFSKVDLFGGL